MCENKECERREVGGERVAERRELCCVLFDVIILLLCRILYIN